MVGVASTIVYAVLYLMLHSLFGAQVSNFVALGISAVFNTAANRGSASGARHGRTPSKHQVFGLGIFMFGWVVTAGSLFVLHAWVPGASKHLELLVLLVANLVATAIRFVGLRWVFRSHTATAATDTADLVVPGNPAADGRGGPGEFRYRTGGRGDSSACMACYNRSRDTGAVFAVASAGGHRGGLSVESVDQRWANSFYSAAIQAGSQSWKAWFFGSSDMANSITVDKPPASLWIPSLSVRVFRIEFWSILVPEALMGVASVALVYVIARRYFGHWAGILAGLVLAVTPVAAMMFRSTTPRRC